MSDGRYSFEYQRRVEFHETDLAGIVHFSNFYRYMETAEHEFMRSLGHAIHQQKDEAEIGWPRVSAHCDFRKPAHNGDILTIRVSIEEIRTRSVRYGFSFYLDSTEPPIASGGVAVVCVKFENGGITAIPIPAQIRADLEAAQASAKLVIDK
ncbi:MAG: 4-hydroxybenzoyl-CoA thioesterase [Verrucomicrobiaceae bacterium]|nr:4-hydroxybenzoyl-CoA thioesterase [Verrucomicrobiaceae bacterium]